MYIKFDGSFYVSQTKELKLSTLVSHYKRGIYFLYNEHEELLYIGWARHLKNRINSHIYGSTHTKWFKNEIFLVKFIYTDSFDEFRNENSDCQDIEYYLIEKLKPRYNERRGRIAAYKQTA